VEVGFLWGRQDTDLVASGTVAVAVAPLTIDNYHGFLAYNFGAADDVVRPYLLGGLGATRYGRIQIAGDSLTLDLPAGSRFSTTWGAGVKVYPARNFGVFGGVRWTPTYIKSDGAGWWCDPWWGGCWVVGNAQYSNQWEFNGGINLRF
jgi:opacity protein-like surface antigen